MEHLLSISIFQWLGLIAGALYIYLASRQKSICWVLSLISTLCIAWEDFLHTKLYIDGALQLFYALIALIGLYYWLAKEDMNASLRISKLPPYKHVAYILFIGLLGGIFGFIVDYSTEAVFSILNGVIAGLSIIATFLLIYKILDAWYYWMVINVAMIVLYFITGAPLFSVLYLIYLVQAIYGLKNWKYEYRKRWSKFKPQTADNIE